MAKSYIYYIFGVVKKKSGGTVLLIFLFEL